MIYSRLILTCLATLALSIAAPALAATPTYAPAPDERQGDGRVSPFYHWTEALPEKPGLLLRSEPLPETIGLKDAGRQLRILFSSTDGVGGVQRTAVSGALFIPRGAPPPGGWPVISWGHGTLGGADICAPSWAGRSYRDVRYLNAWLRAGFAIVASDYQGIGTPGYNPQFNNRANAYSLLDSARAVIHGVPDLANKVLLVGQSQGGSAVIAASGYAADYAPDLDIRGVVGTGIVYSPGRPLRPVKPADPDAADKVDPTLAYGFYHVLAAQQRDPSLKTEEIYSELGAPLLEQARISCLFSVETDVVGLGLTRKTLYKPGYEARQALALGADWQKIPTVRLKHPVFIGAGVEDGLAAADVALAEDICAAGGIAEIHLYGDRDHSGAVNESLRHSLVFARKALAGEPIERVCEPRGVD